MSVIQSIRDRGAWIVFGIIALALIAFILQDGVRSGRGGSNGTTLGKVNGETIDRSDFEEKLTMFGRGQQREQLIAQLWEQEVNTRIMQQEYNKLGLVVSQKELSDILFGDNSPLKKEFTDPQTGIFDVEKAKQAFAQLKKSKNSQQLQGVVEGYINPAVQQQLQQKYQALLQGSMYVPKWMVDKEQADNNLVSAVSYVFVPYTSIPDNEVKVSDDDIMRYAKKHRSEYEKEEETRSISFVSFDATASAADSAAVRSQLNVSKNDFAVTPDPVNFFTKTSSELPYYNSYISKKDIKQAYIDSIVKVPVGSVYGPYTDGNNMVLAKVVGAKQIPDSAKVRHILVSTHQPDQESGTLMRVREDSSARKRMDTVEALLKSGKNFDSVCLVYSDDGSKTKGGVYDYFTSGRMVPAFNDFSFDKPVGSKGVIETEYGYHYVEVLGQKGSGPAYKIAYLAKPIIVSNETDGAASNAAARFAATAKGKKQFDENAAKLLKQSVPSGELKENDYTVNGLGDSRQLVRWVYDHNVGDITDQPVRVADKYVVAIITSISKPGLPSAGILRPLVETLVRNEKKARIIIDTKMKGNNLQSYASSSATTIQKADSLLFSNAFIPGIGSDPKFTGAAFNKDYQNKVTDVIAGTTGVFTLQINKISANANASDNSTTIRQTILQNQRMAMYRGMEALRKAAKIKDYRSKFY
jgi:peptidyl-prolyl cis-trans isomerase D